jgi:hypothetical protein
MIYIVVMNAPSILPSKMTTTNMQKSEQANSRLSLWLQKLPSHTLAVNHRVARKVLNEIADQNSSSTPIALLLQQDPVLCLKLYLQVKRKLNNKDTRIQGLEHLISLMGTESIKQLINQAPKDSQAKYAVSDSQQELYAASFFAAQLASQLLPKKHGTQGKLFFLPALLLNAPLWLMWVAAPKLMALVKTAKSENNKTTNPLEGLFEQKLSFPIHDLLEQTERYLPLPELSLKALTTRLDKDTEFWAKVNYIPMAQLLPWIANDSEAKRRLYAPEIGLYLLNHYALAVYFDKQGKHIKRLGRLAARHLGISEQDFNQDVITIASTLELPQEMKGRFSPLYRYRGLHKELSDDKVYSNTAILKQYLLKLKQSKVSNNSLQLALEAFMQGAEVQRSMIFVIKENRLILKYLAGFTGDALKNLNINFNDAGELFVHLLDQPVVIIADKRKLPRIVQQLPTALAQYWEPRPCGIMSLFNHGEPYAIVVCEHNDWSAQRHEHFTIIGKHLLHNLKHCDY